MFVMPGEPIMPLYEYVCAKCHHDFEALVYDGEEIACPICEGKRLDRCDVFLIIFIISIKIFIQMPCPGSDHLGWRKRTGRLRLGY